MNQDLSKDLNLEISQGLNLDLLQDFSGNLCMFLWVDFSLGFPAESPSTFYGIIGQLKQLSEADLI